MTSKIPLLLQNVPTVYNLTCFVYCVSSNFVSSHVIPSLSNRYFQPLLHEALISGTKT